MKHERFQGNPMDESRIDDPQNGIRLMDIRDYPAVRDLWARTTGMGLNDVDDSPSGIGRYLERNPRTCFVCMDGGAVIGAILAGHDGRRGFIYHACVAVTHRKRGIGRALVNAAMNALEAEGISKTALVVFGRNEPGNAFWERLGFELRTDINYRNKAIVALKRIDT